MTGATRDALFVKNIVDQFTLIDCFYTEIASSNHIILRLLFLPHRYRNEVIAFDEVRIHLDKREVEGKKRTEEKNSLHLNDVINCFFLSQVGTAVDHFASFCLFAARTLVMGKHSFLAPAARLMRLCLFYGTHRQARRTNSV